MASLRGWQALEQARRALETRVGHLWLVHPSLQTLEVYRLEGQHWVVASSHVGAAGARAEPFEAIELDMSRWWLEEA